MPKIIESLRERLLKEARAQSRQAGYDSLTMRGVAQACGVGVGTLYNYFPSKDVLVASFVAEDWHSVMANVFSESAGRSAAQVLQAEYDGIRRFLAMQERLFSDPGAIRTYAALPPGRHEQLRAQLAVPVERALVEGGHPNASFLSLFLAEALLAWAPAGVPWETLFESIRPLLGRC